MKFDIKGKSLFSYLVLVSFIWGFMSCAVKINTREKARNLILSKVIRVDTVTRPVMVFLMENELSPGSVIEPAGFPSLADTLNEKTWFGWIDDEPEAEFAHDTRFIFISSSGGKIKVKPREWYPFLNGAIPLFRDSISLETSRFLILNTAK